MTPILRHDPGLRANFPTLVAAAWVVEGVGHLTALELDPVPHLAVARARFADTTEGALPEIRAWRAAFTTIIGYLLSACIAPPRLTDTRRQRHWRLPAARINEAIE